MRNVFLIAGLMLASLTAYAQVQFIEGQHYKLVVPEQPTTDANKVVRLPTLRRFPAHHYQLARQAFG